MYCFGDGVDKSNLKEQYYFSKASAMGDHSSRNNLGVLEEALGNHERAMKHFRIAACFGNKNAMDSLCRGLEKGLVQMDEYNKTLLAHQKAVEEVKTEEREAYRVLFDSKGDDITSDEFESAKAVWLKSAPWMKECISKFTLKKANPES
jgi:TPR repeat protein